MNHYSFSVLLSQTALANTTQRYSSLNDVSIQRGSVYQQTSTILPDDCECNSNNSLGFATVIKTTSTNDNIVSVGQWLFELTLGASPDNAPGVGLLTLVFAPQNYNFGSVATNQIIWSNDNTTDNVTNGVFYAPINSNIAPEFYVPNGNCVSMIGAVSGQQSSGAYLNAMGAVKLTYYFDCVGNYGAGDILIEVEMDV